MTSTAQKKLNRAAPSCSADCSYGGGRSANRTGGMTIASIFATHQRRRSKNEKRHIGPGTLVLPVRHTLLDATATITEAPDHKIPWKISDIGTVIQFETELPADILEINRLVRVLTTTGCGWCFLDEIKRIG